MIDIEEESNREAQKKPRVEEQIERAQNLSLRRSQHVPTAEAAK